MHALIAEARDMMEDRVPLCSLQDGSAIRWSDLEQFLCGLASPSASARKIIDIVTNRSANRRAFDEYVRQMLLGIGSGLRIT